MKARLSLIHVSLLVLWLTACASVDTKPEPTPAELLTMTTVELIAAANTVADAADLGIIQRDSQDYRRIKDALLAAHTYIELAWSYHSEGNYADAVAAREQAMDTYLLIRASVVALGKRVEN
jgi:hypothetical protein